jgi:uncharacterized protein
MGAARGAYLRGGLAAMLRAPERVVRTLLLALVQGYRLFFRAWLGNRCRYWPSCSAYAVQALQRHGAWTGGALAGARLLRCHPWCLGGEDPVPEALAKPAAGLFTHLFDHDFKAPKNTPRDAPGPRPRKIP